MGHDNFLSVNCEEYVLLEMNLLTGLTRQSRETPRVEGLSDCARGSAL